MNVSVVMKITSTVIPLYLYECVRCYEDILSLVKHL